MDLFEIAAANADRLASRFEALLASAADRSKSLERFAGMVERDGRIAVNVRVQVLIDFLDSDRYLNVYQWASDMARRAGKDAETILRERLGRWYAARVAFDRAFDDGELFRYGALNIGGDGAPHYGSFCMVIRAEVPLKWRVAYLRDDSLKTYVEASGILDEEMLGYDAGPHVGRQHVATLKLERSLASAAEESWPGMLCGPGGIVEAVFVGELQASDIEVVRLGRKEHELLFDYGYKDFTAKLSEVDRLWIDNFRMALDRLDARGIQLEVV